MPPTYSSVLLAAAVCTAVIELGVACGALAWCAVDLCLVWHSGTADPTFTPRAINVFACIVITAFRMNAVAIVTPLARLNLHWNDIAPPTYQLPPHWHSFMCYSALVSITGLPYYLIAPAAAGSPSATFMAFVLWFHTMHVSAYMSQRTLADATRAAAQERAQRYNADEQMPALNGVASDNLSLRVNGAPLNSIKDTASLIETPSAV
jgi:hypothetical protein